MFGLFFFAQPRTLFTALQALRRHFKDVSIFLLKRAALMEMSASNIVHLSSANEEKSAS